MSLLNKLLLKKSTCSSETAMCALLFHVLGSCKTAAAQHCHMHMAAQALHCTRDRHRRIYRHWDAFADQARECLSGVDMAYDLHPFVLQATVQLAMLLETPDDALVLHWDAM